MTKATKAEKNEQYNKWANAYINSGDELRKILYSDELHPTREDGEWDLRYHTNKRAFMEKYEGLPIKQKKYDKTE